MTVNLKIRYPRIKLSRVWWFKPQEVDLSLYGKYTIIQYSPTKGDVYIMGTRFPNKFLDSKKGTWFELEKLTNRWILSHPSNPSPAPHSNVDLQSLFGDFKTLGEKNQFDKHILYQ